MVKKLIYHLRLIRSQTFLEPLNKGQRLRLAFNYTRWLLFYKHNNRDWVIRFENGFRSIVKPFPDDDAGSSNIYTRNVDLLDLEFVRRILKKGDTIIDGGCNVGNRTWALADIIGGAILIDAGQQAMERTREHLQLNQLPESEYILLRKALGEKEGTVRFTEKGGANTGNKILDENAATEKFTVVEMTTIDSIVSEYRYTPAFIKLDVEGHDLLALKGARTTLTSGSVRLVKFELLDKASIPEFREFFTSIGWKIFALDKEGSPTTSEDAFIHLNLFAAPAAYADQYLN